MAGCSTRATKAELDHLTVDMLRQLPCLKGAVSRLNKAQLVDVAYNARQDLAELKEEHLLRVLEKSGRPTSGVCTKTEIIARIRGTAPAAPPAVQRPAVPKPKPKRTTTVAAATTASGPHLRPPPISLELRRLFDRGQVVATFQQYKALAPTIIAAIPAAEILRDKVTHKTMKVFDYRRGKDLYTGLGQEAITSLSPNVDHIYECQLGAMAWTVALSHSPRVRVLRSDTSLIKPIWNGWDNLNVTSAAVNQAKKVGTQHFLRALQDGRPSGYMEEMRGLSGMPLQVVKNMGRTIAMVTNPILDQIEAASHKARTEPQAKVILDFGCELAAIFERMRLQDV